MPAKMVDMDFEVRMALGDLAELLHMAAGEQAHRVALLFAGAPEPVQRAVGPISLLVRLIERETKAEHARPRAPVADDLFLVRRLEIEMAENAELVGICLHRFDCLHVDGFAER